MNLDLLSALITLAADAPSGPPAPPQMAQGDAMLQMIIMFGSLGLIFWLLIWRPESKRRKQAEEVRNSIKPKDRVVTIGGMYGTVVEVEKDEVVLLVDPKKDVKMRFRKQAVDVIEQAAGSEEKK